eukprot:8000292-Lingulodinium_polyedra.AAC.1
MKRIYVTAPLSGPSRSRRGPGQRSNLCNHPQRSRLPVRTASPIWPDRSGTHARSRSGWWP